MEFSVIAYRTNRQGNREVAGSGEGKTIKEAVDKLAANLAEKVQIRQDETDVFQSLWEETQRPL